MERSQQTEVRREEDEQRAGMATLCEQPRTSQPPVDPIPGPMQGVWGGHQGREL